MVWYSVWKHSSQQPVWEYRRCIAVLTGEWWLFYCQQRAVHQLGGVFWNSVRGRQSSVPNSSSSVVDTESWTNRVTSTNCSKPCEYDVVTQMSPSIRNSCIPKTAAYLKLHNTNFFVSLFKVHIHPCPLHEGTGKEGGVTPPILKHGAVVIFTIYQLYPQQETPNSHWIRSCVGSRVLKKK